MKRILRDLLAGIIVGVSFILGGVALSNYHAPPTTKIEAKFLYSSSYIRVYYTVDEVSYSKRFYCPRCIFPFVKSNTIQKDKITLTYPRGKPELASPKKVNTPVMGLILMTSGSGFVLYSLIRAGREALEEK